MTIHGECGGTGGALRALGGPINGRGNAAAWGEGAAMRVLKCEIGFGSLGGPTLEPPPLPPSALIPSSPKREARTHTRARALLALPRPKMHIKRIMLAGFKSYADCTIHLDPKHNIVGESTSRAPPPFRTTALPPTRSPPLGPDAQRPR
jgi:hypothetical protein